MYHSVEYGIGAELWIWNSTKTTFSLYGVLSNEYWFIHKNISKLKDNFSCLFKCCVNLSFPCSLEHLEVAKSTQTMNEEELKRVSENYDAFFFHPVCKLNCFLCWELQLFVLLHLSGIFLRRGRLKIHFCYWHCLTFIYYIIIICLEFSVML